MKLHENSKEFVEAIEFASAQLKMRAVYIEKDYWITYVLRNISLSDYKKKVVFKGGTSLSKAYNLIQRFSEDVDLALISNGENQNQIKKVIKAIELAIATLPLEEKVDDPAASKGSSYRKTVHKYPRAVGKSDFGVVRDDLILEINSFTTPVPNLEVEMESYIAKALRETGQENQIAELGLEKFKVLVLDKKRTLCEKVLAISRASYESDERHSVLRAKIRHLYDIAILVSDKDVNEFLTGLEVNSLFKNVLADDQTTSQASKVGLWHEAPIFKNSSSIMDEIAGTYNSDFAQMLHDAEIKPTIKEIISSLDFLKSKITVA